MNAEVASAPGVPSCFRSRNGMATIAVPMVAARTRDWNSPSWKSHITKPLPMNWNGPCMNGTCLYVSWFAVPRVRNWLRPFLNP